jgi:ABC-type bacteriocin/lantibiotic exporter with double-glycine peptidase domain
MAMESLECGAAALAMICAYYGKWIPLEQVRVDCGVSRDGASIENIAKAARFAADRSIRDYADRIWNTDSII